MSYNFKKNLLALTITLSIGLGLVATPHISRGAETTSDGKYTVLAPLPCIEGNGISCKDGNGSLVETVDFKTYVQYTFNLLIALSAAFAVVQLVWGGLEYIITTSVTNKKSSLDRAKNAIIGLVLVLTSFIILRTVDPRLTEIPNTLVPEITFNSELANDAYAKLMNSVASDTSKYTMRGYEIGNEVSADKTELREAIAKANETAKKINELKSAASSTENAKLISELEKQWASELQIVSEKIISLNISEFKIDVNGLIRDSLNRIDGAFEDKYNQEDMQRAMKEIGKNKDSLTELKNRRIKNLQEVGAVDIEPINRLDTYGQNLLNLQRIKLANMSVREIKPSGKVEMVNADGTIVTFPSKDAATKFLKSWTRIIKSNGQSLSPDPELKKLFDSDCDSMINDIDQNEYLK